MKISNRARPRAKRSRTAVILFAITAILGLSLWIDASMRPVIEQIIAYQAKIYGTRLVNEAMITQMEHNEIDYEKLIRITRGSDGEVMSIEADMAHINTLKSKVSKTVIQNLEMAENHRITIPIGTIIGNQFTSGRGPRIEIQVIPAGYVQSEIYNQFSAVGINQTLHQIMLRVSVQMSAVMPGYNIKTETVTNFCIAETVIVGKIPDGYASVDMGLATFSPIQK